MGVGATSTDDKESRNAVRRRLSHCTLRLHGRKHRLPRAHEEGL